MTEFAEITSSPDFVPGTVHLVDIDGTLRARHSQGKNQDIILVPPPSADPNDPLNWSPTRKLVFTASLCVYIVVVGIPAAALYSVLVPISHATLLSVNDLNSGTGYMFLAFGWSCLFWQPLAQRYGKRPVYLISTLGTMAIMLWAPYTRTNSDWIANKVMQGFFGAPIESLCEISVSDVYFAHERGTYIGVYALFLITSQFFAPLISGFINDGQGWQWVFYWCGIFNGVGFVILLFFMEETNFPRQPLLGMEPNRQDASESQSINDSAGQQKNPASLERLPQSENVLIHEIEQDSTVVPRTKSFWQKMRLFEKHVFTKNKESEIKRMVLRPLIFTTFPVIFFCGFMYGAVICYFNVLNGTASLILSQPPYNFRASIVGTAYISSMIGSFIGAYYSGPLGDRFVIWMARRNSGIMEPEHRLWLYCALLVFIPGGLLIWGLGAAYHVHWFGLVFALGILAACITIGCQLPVSYCIDSYKDISGDSLVSVILVRNTMSFAVSYGLTPWVMNMGYRNAFIVAASVSFGQLLLFFAFIKWGHNLRKSSVARYLKYVDQMQRAHVH